GNDDADPAVGREQRACDRERVDEARPVLQHVPKGDRLVGRVSRSRLEGIVNSVAHRRARMRHRGGARLDAPGVQAALDGRFEKDAARAPDVEEPRSAAQTEPLEPIEPLRGLAQRYRTLRLEVVAVTVPRSLEVLASVGRLERLGRGDRVDELEIARRTAEDPKLPAREPMGARGAAEGTRGHHSSTPCTAGFAGARRAFVTMLRI